MQPRLVQWWHVDNSLHLCSSPHIIHNESKLSVNDSWSILTLLLTYRFRSCTILKYITMGSCYGSLHIPSHRYIMDDIYFFLSPWQTYSVINSVQMTLKICWRFHHIVNTSEAECCPCWAVMVWICSAPRPCPHACGYFYKHSFFSAIYPFVHKQTDL